MSRNDSNGEVIADYPVTSREGRVSRNQLLGTGKDYGMVTSREGRVSRNIIFFTDIHVFAVTSREGRVSRNFCQRPHCPDAVSRPARDV